MIADDVITAVHEPTDWVNSIVCNIKETPEGNKKIRLCLDPKDLNKNIGREHYYTCTIDELLPQLCGKKFFSVVDTKKGYWHVALDHESSLLCTFNTPLQYPHIWFMFLWVRLTSTLHSVLQNRLPTATVKYRQSTPLVM